MVQAHVIRMTKPFDENEVAIPHYHDVDFQMVYVLKGSFTERVRGPGRAHLPCRLVLDPAAEDQAHACCGYSDDCEFLEIILPANFDTVTLK